MHLLITLLFAIATAHRSSFRAVNTLTWAHNVPDTMTELTTTIAAVIVTGTFTDSELTGEEELTLHFTAEDKETFAEVTKWITTGTATPTGTTSPMPFTSASITLSGFPLVAVGKIYLWISYGAEGATKEKVTGDITIQPATTAFTVTPATVPANLLGYLPTITIAAANVAAPITVKIEPETDSGSNLETELTKKITTKSGDNFVWTLNAGELTEAFGALAATKKLTVSVSLTDEGPYLLTKKTIDVVAGPTYSIATDEPVWSEFTLPFEIEVAGPPASVRASNVWAANWSYVVSKTPFLTTVDPNNDFTKANQAPATGDKYIITIDSTANTSLKITGPTTLFVYAVNADTITPASVIPCVFKIKADPILFTVGDISINNDAEIPTLTITAADDSQGWHTTKIAAKLVWNSISILVNLTNGGSTNAAKTYTATGVDVSTWVDIPDEANVVIHAALTAESTIVYLPDTVTKKVTVDPEPPAADFNFLPAAISYEETSVVISAEPTTPTAWDAKTVKCIFTFVKTKPTTEPAGLTFDLVKATPPTGNPEPTVYDWKATVDMTKVTVPKDKTIIYAWIKLTDVVPPTSNAEEVLEEPFEITYTHAPKADFTVKPDKVDLRTDTKINVEVTKTATGAWVDDVYFHFAKAAVSAQPEDDKFVKATKATGKWTYELTLSTLTDLKKGDNIYVYVKHDVQTPAPTSNTKTGTFLEVPVLIPVDKTDAPPAAAMGVSPLLSLLAAALLLLVKLL